MSRIRFDEGTSYHPGWTIRDRAGNPVPLQGATLTFAVFRQTDPLTGNPIPWLVKDNSDNGSLIVVDSANGIIRVDFDHSDTINKGGNAYPWELRLEPPDDEERTIDKGYLIIRPRRLDTIDPV